MKLILLACIIVAATNIAKALEDEKVAREAIKKFTPYKPSIFAWRTVTTAYVEDENQNIKTCFVEFIEQPRKGGLHTVKIDCYGQETIWQSIYKNSSAASSGTKYYHYVDGQKMDLFAPSEKENEVQSV